jgi:outer membrane protein, adhesin transport system
MPQRPDSSGATFVRVLKWQLLLGVALSCSFAFAQEGAPPRLELEPTASFSDALEAPAASFPPAADLAFKLPDEEQLALMAAETTTFSDVGVHRELAFVREDEAAVSEKPPVATELAGAAPLPEGPAEAPQTPAETPQTEVATRAIDLEQLPNAAPAEAVVAIGTAAQTSAVEEAVAPPIAEATVEPAQSQVAALTADQHQPATPTVLEPPAPAPAPVEIVTAPEPRSAAVPVPTPTAEAPAQAVLVSATDQAVPSGPSAAPPERAPMTVVRMRDTAAAPEPEIENLREAIAAALNENPDIQIAKARQDDAFYGVREARAAWMPRVDVSASYGPEYNNPSQGNSGMEQRKEGSATLRQTVWDFGLTLNDVRRARALYESAEWATREQIEAIAFEISVAYIGVLERERLVQLAEESIAAHERILKMVTTQRDLGLATGADVSRVETRLNNVRAAALDRKSERDQARERYRRLVKRLPGQVVELPEPAAMLPAEADAAVAMIETKSPRLQQTMSDKRSLQSQRSAQRGNFFPKVELELQGNWKDDVSGDTNRNRDARAMVVMRYNLFNGGRDVATLRRIEARQREVEFEVDRVRRDVEQDIRNDFSALKAAQDKVATIDKEVAAAREVERLYAEQFKAGKRTAFDLLDSQQSLFNARGTQVSNRYQQLVSSYRILQKLGGLFEFLSTADAPTKL